MTNHSDTQALVTSPRANQARARLVGESVEFDWLPRWLIASLQLPDRFPIKVPRTPGHQLRPFAIIAADMINQSVSLHEYLVEIEAGKEGRIAILVDGQLEQRDGASAALLYMQDVTEIVRQRRRAAAVGSYHGLIGRSLAMLEVFRRIELYGPTEAPVIITGETGTGKELVARALHQRSPRAKGPYVAVNCTALTPELFESELFGHEKGAFTGAIRQHRGRFERADGGTMFLDEIGDMPMFTQSKLLRALEEGVVERVGSEAEQRVDVRVIAATNVALEQAVAQGRFRPDLYHRLSVFRVHLPPLRERTGDIPLLVEYYIEVFNRRYSKGIKRMTPEALRVLEEYTWPGNVRELRNVMERVFVETTGEAIGAKSLAGWIAEREYMIPGDWNVDAFYAPRSPIIPPRTELQRATPPQPSYPWHQEFPRPQYIAPISIPGDQIIIEADNHTFAPETPKQGLTEEIIRDAFRQSGGNITGAARRLNLHKATLYRHMKRLNLSREELEKHSEDES